MSEPDKDSPFHRFERAGATKPQLDMLTAALRASPELVRSDDVCLVRATGRGLRPQAHPR